MSELRRRAMMQHRSGGGLPAEYQRVEYIESSGTEYFKLPSITGVPTSIEIDFIPYHWDGGYYETYLGQSSNLNTDFLYCNYRQTNALEVRCCGTQVITQNATGVRTLIYADQSILKINEEEYSHNAISSWGTGNSYYGLFLSPFQGAASSRISKMRIYSAKMVSDGEVFYNLVPCYRKTDSEAGLYDLVSGEFFTNQGTGTFIVGEDVN